MPTVSTGLSPPPDLPPLAGLAHRPCEPQELTIHHPAYYDTWRAGAYDNRLAFTISPLCGGGSQMLRLFQLDGGLDGSEWNMRISWQAAEYSPNYLFRMDAPSTLIPPSIPPKKGYYLGLTMGDSVQLVNTNVSAVFEIVRLRTWAERRDWVSGLLDAGAVALVVVLVSAVHARAAKRRIRLPLDVEEGPGGDEGAAAAPL